MILITVLLCRSMGGHDFLSKFYDRFYNRMGPYVIGLMLGYFMYNNQDINRLNGRKLHLYIVVCGWISSTITGLVLVYGVVNYYQVDLSCVTGTKQCFSTAGAVLYAAFARASWGSVVAWIIFACHTGYAGEYVLI